MSRISPEIHKVYLQWGYDELIIEDPEWCRAIAQEAREPLPGPDYGADVPYSRRDDELNSRMAEVGFTTRIDQQGRPRGIAQPLQRPVATRCLREFLEVGLPAALLLRYSWGQPTRFIALRVNLEVYTAIPPNTLKVNFVFEGLQLYATGHIGQPVRMQRVAERAQMQRRSLDNVWRNCSFDGLTQPDGPVDRWARPDHRTFYLADGHIVTAAGASIRKLPT